MTASDLRFRFRLSVMRRWIWPPEVHRGLYPIMVPSDPFHWRVAAYGNSIFIGPLVFSWRSRP